MDRVQLLFRCTCSPPWREEGFSLRLIGLGIVLALVGGFCHAGDAMLLAPRVVAALEQGEAAEHGIGGFRRPRLALVRYCDAGAMGSPEGFFHVGRLLRQRNSVQYEPLLANAYLGLAARLGHRRAAELHDPVIGEAPLPEDCGGFFHTLHGEAFDMEAYLAGLTLPKQKIAALIRRHAPRFEVDTRFALAVALAESNLNHLAVSPKNAQGVMQLIPDTQERFGVKKPFDPESNIRGALTYLRWLSARFDGDLSLVAAAYNAGEGVVERYGGIPPYPETQQYVRRVFYFSGIRSTAFD